MTLPNRRWTSGKTVVRRFLDRLLTNRGVYDRDDAGEIALVDRPGAALHDGAPPREVKALLHARWWLCRAGTTAWLAFPAL